MALLIAAPAPAAGEPDVLPGTERLTWEGPLDVRMMKGAHRFIERQIDEAAGRRGRFWDRDTSSPGAYAESIEPNRRRFRKIIGVVDERRPPAMQRFAEGADPVVVAENGVAEVAAVRWPVLEHVWGEGLLVRPKTAAEQDSAGEQGAGLVVYLPDAGQTPEEVLGLTENKATATARAVLELAAAGYEVVIPVLVDREEHTADVPWRDRSDQSNREWVHRQAFHMGRHVIGYEVQKVLACVDWFEGRHGGGGDTAQVGVGGYGEGGLVAFYAAAADPRIDAAAVAGYFGPRQRLWAEPIYRNVFRLLRRFGDAEIATLIAPRPLLVEYAPVPRIETEQEQKGKLTTPPFDAVKREYQRARGLAEGLDLDAWGLKKADGQPGAASLRWLGRTLGLAQDQKSEITNQKSASFQPLRDRRESFDPAARQVRQVRGMERHVQGLVRTANRARDRFFLHEVMPELGERHWNTELHHEPLPLEKFVEGAKKYRRYFRKHITGTFDEPVLEPNPRTRKIYDNERWTGYEVVLDVYPELFAWGVLLVPKDIKPGERRPVVVAQHGRNGLPKSVIEGGSGAYRDFAARLAARGFIVFAPHNLYRGEDRYRWLDRKAQTIGTTLFSFITDQHEQILRWLGTLEYVDAERIAFYGLSYGGKTAMRVPTVLEGYALSICSGDFNQWTRKVASTNRWFSFMFTIEWEIPYFNMGPTFDYAELAYLMIPRPFMVERGHRDWVGADAWVAHEYAKVRRVYTELGIPERTRIEYFPGGHVIRARGTFDFLHKHLDWPKPK